jgi:hypothetical protein
MAWDNFGGMMQGMGGFDFSGGPDYNSISNTLRQISPDPNAAFSAVMDTRGENPGGIPHPLLQGKSPEELALYDRYGSAQQARQTLGFPMAAMGALPIAAYEGIKGISQNVPGMSGLLPMIGRLTGDKKAEQNYAMNSSTSPASFNNVSAYLRGLFDTPQSMSGMGGFFGQ